MLVSIVIFRSETEIRKKKHHCGKIIRKAVKKSKQFEIRKILRRLKGIKETNATEAVETVSNLERQLDIARQADVEKMSEYMICSIEGEISDGNTVDPSTVGIDVKNVVYRRILSAKCVLLEKDSMLKAIKMLEEKKTRVAALKVSETQDPTNDSLLTDVVETTGTDNCAINQQQNSDSEIGQSSDGNVDQGHGTYSLPTEKMTNGSPNSENKSQGNSGKERRQGKLMKKQKNRLGQRARRRLAEQQYGWKASHLREETKSPKLNKSNKIIEAAHPSWEARKSAKENTPIRIDPNKVSISKRTSFDNKMNTDSMEGMHPSWVQKKIKAESQRIVESQGKKIVFDGDSD